MRESSTKKRDHEATDASVKLLKPVYQWAAHTPSQEAIRTNEHSLSYSELIRRTEALARKLHDAGVRTRDIVAFLLTDQIDCYLTILATLRLGATYLPLDAESSPERIKMLLRASHPRLLVVSESFKMDIPEGIKCLSPSSEGDFELPAPWPDSHEDLPAYVLFTSGSTGTPKGVLMGSSALENLINWQNRQTGFEHPAPTVQFAPLFFDVSFQEIFSTLSTGGTLIPASSAERRDPTLLIDRIERERAERLFAPFVALQSLAETARRTNRPLQSLRQVVTAGEQLRITSEISWLFSQNPRCRLHNHYGPTETHVATALTLPEDVTIWPTLPSIGRPIEGALVEIRDESGATRPKGETGEIWIGGVCVAQGYLNQPELTRERFVTDRETGIRWYRTGDLARIAHSGEIEFLGRNDFQVKIRGHRVELGEVEHAIAAIAGVRYAVAHAISSNGTTRLVGYLVLNDATLLPDASIREAMRQAVPEYMIPSVFVRLTEIPKTPSGKIDRKALPPPPSTRPELLTAFSSPESGDHSAILRIWEDVLGLTGIGVDDNFFELGGTSIAAVRCVAAMHERGFPGTTVGRLYDSPTIRRISTALKAESSTLTASRRAADRDASAPIAIIGMALRVPGASDLEMFWQNLISGKESITFFKTPSASLPRTITGHPSYVSARGVIERADEFDASLFGVSPREASLLDPQQRVLLELAWEGLEHAGIPPKTSSETVGVYVGVGNNTYYLRNILANPGALDSASSFQAMTANEKDYAATRLAHLLNLKGPAVSVNTACSTSLVAVCTAVEALRAGSADVAIAGGVSVTAPLDGGYLSLDGAMLSPDGHTRPFDESGRGTVFSDGGGVVVLKRLDQAQREGNRIYGVIRGVGVANDGGDKASFSAPSANGQARAIMSALLDSGTSAKEIGFIEAHGTGTALGDPIEIEGITSAFSKDQVPSGSCALGSVKGNIGHLTAGAGVVGLIKAVLALEHGILPPSINCTTPHPSIPWERTPVVVATRSTPIPENRRTAGVSSFGVGGTNAHVIVSASPASPRETAAQGERSLIPFSTRSEQAAQEFSSRITSWISAHPETPLRDIGYSFARGRARLAHRAAIVVRRDPQSLSVRTISPPPIPTTPTSVVALFPGQGSHYAGMGKGLYAEDPVFRASLDEIEEIASPHLGFSLKEKMWSSDPNELRPTRISQPALFAMEYSLASAWRARGITFSAMIGHSLGEFTAAALAGVFSLQEALTLVTARGALMDELPGGTMLSVRASRVELEPILPDGISLAAENAPSLCVVSGPSDGITALEALLNTRSIPSKRLQTSHAFHSSMVDPAVSRFLEVVQKVALSAPKTPIFSTATGALLSDAEATDPAYWASHMRRTVLFRSALTACATDTSRAFLEVGPRATLSTLTRQSLESSRVVISSLGDNPSDEVEALWGAIGSLWCSRFEFDPITVYGPYARRVGGPAYPFARERHWIEAPRPSERADKDVDHDQSVKGSGVSSMVVPSPSHPLLEEVRGVFETHSGLDLRGASTKAHYTELGLDSLLLTQIAIEITGKYGVPVSFRQLMGDLSTLESLISHLSSHGAAPRSSSPPQAELRSAPSTPSVVPDTYAPGSVEQLIASQLQLLSAQLHALAASRGSAITTPASTVVQPKNPESNESKPFGAGPRLTKTSDASDAMLDAAALNDFIARYSSKTARSKEYTQNNRGVLADPRVVTGFSPLLKEITYPIVVVRSKESRLWDIDGNEYIDLLNGFGSNFFGHSAEYIAQAVRAQIDRGIELGPMTPLAGEVAQLVSDLTGHARVAFCNTGSEAVMAAMRIARTVTGRKKIALFSGSYHGNFDEVVLRQGRGECALPAAPGINPSMVENIVMLPYGTEESLAYLRSHSSEFAAVMVEPVQSRRPDLQPREFLLEVRAITEQTETALICDEVICGFRIHPAGAQGYFGFKADLATYGKVAGGGYPLGLVAGSSKWMDAIDGGQWRYGDQSTPEIGVTYLAGTFVRHPLALAAAKAALSHLKSQGPSLQKSLNDRTTRAVNEINTFLQESSVPVSIRHFGSVMKVSVSETIRRGELLFHALRLRGIYVLDGFPCFFSLAHSDQDIQSVIKAFKESVADLQKLGVFPAVRREPHEPKPDESRGATSVPPVPGARLGRDRAGRPAWFIPDPKRPGRFIQIGEIQ